jgi:hypothetical protein
MWFSKRKRTSGTLRRAFGKFLSDDAIKALEENPESLSLPLSREAIGYVLLQVRDDTDGDIRRNLPRVLDLIVDAGGMIESLLSSHVAASFDHRSPISPRQMKDLSAKLGPDVRSIYFFAELLRGNYGSTMRSTYGTIVPDMGALLGELHQLEFGACKESTQQR